MSEINKDTIISGTNKTLEQVAQNTSTEEIVIGDSNITEDTKAVINEVDYIPYVNSEVNIGATNVSNTPTWFKQGKNLANCNGFTTYTATNITVTPSFTNGQLDYINATKSASSTDNVFVNLTQFTFNLETGTYILNGCPSGGGNSTYSLYFRDNTTNTDVSPRDTGSGASVSLTNGHNYTLYLRIANTSTFTDKKFYPMLRKATITDDTYEPYVQKAININGEDEYYTNDYSTTEQVVGKWINGKSVYRKVVDYFPTEIIGAGGTTTNIQVPHNISNFRQIINCRVVTETNHVFPTLASSTGSTLTAGNAVIQVNSTNIIFRIINDSWSARHFYFILEYTKTTD